MLHSVFDSDKRASFRHRATLPRTASPVIPPFFLGTRGRTEIADWCRSSGGSETGRALIAAVFDSNAGDRNGGSDVASCADHQIGPMNVTTLCRGLSCASGSDGSCRSSSRPFAISFFFFLSLFVLLSHFRTTWAGGSRVCAGKFIAES